jgi:hypothetical protein
MSEGMGLPAAAYSRLVPFSARPTAVRRARALHRALPRAPSPFLLAGTNPVGQSSDDWNAGGRSAPLE